MKPPDKWICRLENKGMIVYYYFSRSGKLMKKIYRKGKE